MRILCASKLVWVYEGRLAHDERLTHDVGGLPGVKAPRAVVISAPAASHLFASFGRNKQNYVSLGSPPIPLILRNI